MENSGNSKSSGRVISVLLAGAVAGATLGLLFAPSKGSELRGKLFNGAKGKVSDIKQKLMDEASQLRNKADELESLAKEKLTSISNNSLKHKTESLRAQS